MGDCFLGHNRAGLAREATDGFPMEDPFSRERGEEADGFPMVRVA